MSPPRRHTLPIGPTVRALRTARRWTQAELAQQLGLSQPRLSQIERGDGSFSAEQFLQILALFNVGVEHFVRDRAAGTDTAIQNALARHGARHLVEGDVIVPALLDDPTELVSAVLRAPTSPRHITALAPVLVASADTLTLDEVAARLARLGRERRVVWLAESVRDAITQEPPTAPAERAAARRALLVLELFVQTTGIRPPSPDAPLDVLDAEVRSLKTAECVFAEASDEARRWRIVTRLRTEDFVAALRSAREPRSRSSPTLDAASRPAPVTTTSGTARFAKN